MIGLDNLQTRLNYRGGSQEHRMQKDKLNSFHKALLYSYQAADITLNSSQYRCLINPDKIKQDYDDKIISIDFDANMKTGDVFKWDNTNTYWLVYLEHFEEDAYFRGEIRRCRYDISFKVGETVYSTKAAVRGPVETKIVHNLKANVSYDDPNLTLEILIPKNVQTEAYFIRYNKFMSGGICWQIQAVDSFSMPGIIQLTAKEYFKDDFKDTDTVVNGLVEPVDPDPHEITGEQIVQLYEEYTYTVPTGEGVGWIVRPRGHVEVVGQSTTDSIKLRPIKAGDITLMNGASEQSYEFSKPIRIESLF